MDEEHPIIEWIPTSHLKLDIENPRIASIVADSSLNQDELVELLWTEMAVAEIAISIAVNGFFQGEPLYVIPNNNGSQGDIESFIVIEGNRRLAAVKILLDGKLRAKVRATELESYISQEIISTLHTLPVVRYETREDLWKFLGFRHINGPKPWDAFSKARYIAQVHDDYNTPLSEIAKMIGDQHSTVKRLYRGYEVLLQAENQTAFNKEDRFRNKFYFSHLYTALDQPQFQEFLSIERENSLTPNPVPQSHLPQLEELMVWLYGNKANGLEPIVRRQNPDLNILREVIADSEALTVFRNLAAKGSPFALARSQEIAIGDKQRFSNALIEGKEKLQQASATVSTGYKGEDSLFEIALDVVATAQGLIKSMKSTRSKK